VSASGMFFSPHEGKKHVTCQRGSGIMALLCAQNIGKMG
jgi:hypothetical protein